MGACLVKAYLKSPFRNTQVGSSKREIPIPINTIRLSTVIQKVIDVLTVPNDVPSLDKWRSSSYKLSQWRDRETGSLTLQLDQHRSVTLVPRLAANSLV